MVRIYRPWRFYSPIQRYPIYHGYLSLKLPRDILLFVWVLSPFIGLLCEYSLSLFGLNLVDFLKYTSDGYTSTYFVKVLVSIVMCIVLLISIRLHPSKDIDFRHIYITLVSIANVLIKYEIPFERLLLFSDFIAPLALVTRSDRQRPANAIFYRFSVRRFNLLGFFMDTCVSGAYPWFQLEKILARANSDQSRFGTQKLDTFATTFTA